MLASRKYDVLAKQAIVLNVLETGVLQHRTIFCSNPNLACDIKLQFVNEFSEAEGQFLWIFQGKQEWASIIRRESEGVSGSEKEIGKKPLSRLRSRREP